MVTVFWVIAIALMEAASASETSVSFYQTTRRNIPEDSHFKQQEDHVRHLNAYRKIILE
jgi:hypothetical protein